MLVAKATMITTYKVRDIGVMRDFQSKHFLCNRAAGTPTEPKPGQSAALHAFCGMSSAHATKTPMAQGTSLTREVAPLLATDNCYSTLVGGLLSLATTTCPDIAYATGALSGFMHKPDMAHWRDAKYVLRYMSGSARMGLCFRAGGVLVGSCDADCAGNQVKRRWTSGWYFCSNGAVVSWASKLKPTVSVSTAEAEYLAAAAVGREALWQQRLLSDLGEEAAPIRLAEENQAGLAMLRIPERTGRAKHMDVANHFVRNRVARVEVVFFCKPSADMVLDGLTRPLASPAFMTFRDRRRVGEARMGPRRTSANARWRVASVPPWGSVGGHCLAVHHTVADISVLIGLSAVL